ncbi:MAG: fold metallo-hydrolase [Actinomycetia bacterium]|nr:fold metallo-hydrolase [Actinomycetes bacterium]
MNVTFWGVRGSTPCPCDRNRRYGGNTACVSLEVAGEDPIVLDLGTGLRFWGETLAQDGNFRATALLTHIHWDHVQGLPFFVPALQAGSHLDIYGPPDGGGTLEEAFDEFMRPPFFPVRVRDLLGEIRFHDVTDTDLSIGGAKVRVRPVPHTGATNGYRIEWDGATVAYISDHQSPSGPDGEGHTIAEAVLELCDGVDLLIHDTQYWAGEWAQKRDWGHCTVDYAVRVARESGAHRLVLFHHDPAHDDAEVDRMLAHARAAAADCGIEEVIAAAEGLTISLDK